MECAELSLHMGINRNKYAQAVKADTIVTTCSCCDSNLYRTAKSMDSDIKSLDITVMLANAVGL